MTVREGRAAPRPSAQKPPVQQIASIPSPALGLIALGNLAQPQPGGAFMLENFIPTATSAVLRRGSQAHATIGTDGAAVTALFSYVNGNIRKMFAANESAIYDVTTPDQAQDLFLVNGAGYFYVDADGNFIIDAATPEAEVDSLSGGDWSVTQFATSGGVFLRAVNGLDTPLVYDGSSWGTTPAITGATPTTLSYVWPFKNRLFFVEKDSLDAWYLPVDSIGGAAVVFPLGGVFERGGSLLFGSSWSLDTGSGLNEQCIFVTTEGEVAVYQGTDPGSADTWTKVGVYRIGKPLGANAHFRAGGDIVIATDIGLIPLSQALQKDYAALAPAAISANIETIWNDEVKVRSDVDWNCAVWSRNQIAIVSPVTPSGQTPVMYAANTRTGAWGKITGWDATCVHVFNDRFFFGTSNGLIIEGNVTGQDSQRPYTGTYVPLFSDFGSPAIKTTGTTRAILRASAPVNDKLTMQKEFAVSLPPSPDASSTITDGLWGTGVWGQSSWGTEASKNTYQVWRSTPSNGNSLAPSLQITSGGTAPLDVEIVRVDVTYTIDGLVG